MPRGFEDYDGYTRNAESRLRWFVLELMGHHPPDNPIKASKVSAMTAWDGKWDPTEKKMVGFRKGLTGREVRAMTNYLRREWNYPIGSGAAGYYWCQDKEELETTLNHLKDRITALNQAVDGIANANMDLDPFTVLAEPEKSEKPFERDFRTIAEMAADALGHVVQDKLPEPEEVTIQRTLYVKMEDRDLIHVLGDDDGGSRHGVTLCGKHVDHKRDHVMEKGTEPPVKMCKICKKLKPGISQNPNQTGLFDVQAES